jgi:thioredoxin 1
MADQITDADFQKEVLESDVPVLVDFWAPWCAPCKVLGPVIDGLAEEVRGAKVLKMNIDENPEAAGKYGITTIPTVLIFEKGEVKEKLVGMQPKPKYLEALGI